MRATASRPPLYRRLGHDDGFGAVAWRTEARAAARRRGQPRHPGNDRPAAPCGAAVVQPAPCSVLVLDTRLACPAQLGGTDNAPIDDARLRPAASGAAPRPAAIGASPTAASAAPSSDRPAPSKPSSRAASSAAGRRPPLASPSKSDAAETQFPAPMLKILAISEIQEGTFPGVEPKMLAIPDNGEAAADELAASVAA